MRAPGVADRESNVGATHVALAFGPAWMQVQGPPSRLIVTVPAPHSAESSGPVSQNLPFLALSAVQLLFFCTQNVHKLQH